MKAIWNFFRTIWIGVKLALGVVTMLYAVTGYIEQTYTTRKLAQKHQIDMYEANEVYVSKLLEKAKMVF